MNKITISVLLVLAILSLALLCGCQPDDGYVKERLSNSGDHVIEGIWVPFSTFSSRLPSSTDNIEHITKVLSSFEKLEFTYDKKIDNETFKEIEKGEFGLEPEVTEHYWLPLGISLKWVLSVYYTNGTIGLILIEIDGTVYYVNDKDKLLLKTAPNAVNPADFKPIYHHGDI